MAVKNRVNWDSYEVPVCLLGGKAAVAEAAAMPTPEGAE